MKHPNQLFSLNRPASPLPQPAIQQHGNFSLGFRYPHPFSQQHSADHQPTSLRKVYGTEYPRLNFNQFYDRAVGYIWDFARSGAQYLENSQSLPAPLESSTPGEPSSLSDILSTRHPTPANGSKTYPGGPYFDTQLDASWIPNSIPQAPPLLTEHPPFNEQLTELTLAGSNDQPPLEINVQETSGFPQTYFAPEDKENSDLTDHALASDTAQTSVASSRGNRQSGTSSEVPAQRHEEPKTKRWKRKMTERRREQNRIHQRAFRDRHKLSLKEKDELICNLKERMNRYQETAAKHSEQIRILKARLSQH